MAMKNDAKPLNLSKPQQDLLRRVIARQEGVSIYSANPRTARALASRGLIRLDVRADDPSLNRWHATDAGRIEAVRYQKQLEDEAAEYLRSVGAQQ